MANHVVHADPDGDGFYVTKRGRVVARFDDEETAKKKAVHLDKIRAEYKESDEYKAEHPPSPDDPPGPDDPPPPPPRKEGDPPKGDPPPKNDPPAKKSSWWGTNVGD